MILAIDTSTDQASVALADENRTRAEISWTAAGNHSSMLTVMIRRLLALDGTDAAALTGVVVARGPGSFSGLRVGISEAQGLSLALDVPLVGIGTLDVIAFQASGLSSTILTVLPAGREQLYVAEFETEGDSLRRTSDYQILSVEATAARAQGKLLAGDGATLVTEYAEAAGWSCDVVSPPWRLRRAGFLAELGSRSLAGGAGLSETVEPLYLRPSAAEEKRATRE